jgi:hypothetical protein
MEHTPSANGVTEEFDHGDHELDTTSSIEESSIECSSSDCSSCDVRSSTASIESKVDSNRQCIAYLRSHPDRRCMRMAIASGYCGVHKRHSDRQLFQSNVDDCSVCLGVMRYKTRIPSCTTQVIPPDDPIQGKGILRTTCGHTYHTRCLKRWMVHHNNLTCPMCRASIMVDMGQLTGIPYYKRLCLIYEHFPPPRMAYTFPTHLSSMLNMPSVIRALGMSEEQRAIVVDIAWNTMFSEIFFRVLRLNRGLLEI